MTRAVLIQCLQNSGLQRTMTRVVVAAALLASTAHQVFGDTITIQASGEGWCANAAAACNNPDPASINNTLAGSHGFDGPQVEFRNWFAFSLPAAGFTSGSLNIWNDEEDFTTVAEAVYELRDASAISFEGLLGTMRLGSINVQAADTGQSHFVSIPLNPNAIELLNAADRNRPFVFGGIVTPFSSSEVQIFGYTIGIPRAFLELSPAPTPEPASMLLLATGLAGLFAFRSRCERTRSA